ncbi:MAG: DUF4290 domain-containing protein [Saprospiraceae bacterium]|nr:DUF4290 domain-containing protein [Saprospiraceae bacterium]
MPTFEYNSQRDILIIPEYGRHIQKMIDFAKTIEDPGKRQRTAEAIVDLMNQMVPQGKQEEDYTDKLWKHFFRIADYEIDVTPPSGQKPEKHEIKRDLDSLPYSQSDLKYRHYGKNVNTMIARAMEMEDGPIKDGFIHTIASYMKLAYKNWNKDHYVSDDNIVTDITMMSHNQLNLPDGSNLDLLGNSLKNAPNNGSATRKRKGQPKRNNYKNRKKRH